MLHRLAPHLLLAALAATCATACGDDPSPEYTISMTLSDTTLSADGSDGATLSVTVIDENDVRPPLAGDVVPIQCQDTNGEASARIGTSDEVGRGVATLDGLGIDQVEIRCSGDDGSDYKVQCIAVYEGATGMLPPFDCRTSVSGS